MKSSHGGERSSLLEKETFFTPRSTIDSSTELDGPTANGLLHSPESSSSNQFTTSRVSWRENGNQDSLRGITFSAKRNGPTSPPYPIHSMPAPLLRAFPSSASFHGEHYMSAAYSLAGDLPSVDHPIGILPENSYGFDSFLSPLNRLDESDFETNKCFL